MDKDILEKSHALFEETEELAKLGHYEWDEERDICAYCSVEFARLHGTTPTGYMQMVKSRRDDAKFVHPEDRANYLSSVDKAIEDGVEAQVEYRLVQLGGKVIEVREVIKFETDETGEVFRSFGFVQDIGDRRRLERELRAVRDDLEKRVIERTSELKESESRYRELIEESDIGIWEENWSEVKRRIDELRDGGVTNVGAYLDENPDVLRSLYVLAESEILVSQATLRLYDVPNVNTLREWQRDEKNLDSELLDLDYVAFRDTLAKFCTEDWSNVVEESFSLSNGEFRSLNVNIILPSRHRKDWSRVVYVIEDVTERANAEARLKQAVRLAGIGYYIWDAVEDKCLFCSEQHARIHDLTPAEYAERAASLDEEFTLVHPDDRDVVKQKMRELRAGKAIEIEYRSLRPQGEARDVREFVEPVFDEDGRVVREIGTSQDVTEQRRTEVQLRQAQKLEAIGRLTGGVAHDFNNLLAVIIGNAELLLHESGGDNKMLQAMLRAAERGASLTQQLLAFSLAQTLTPRPTDINKLITSTHNMLTRTLGETVTIRTSLDPQLWATRVDPGQLENAVLNLAINSRDAMPKGGTITIETANCPYESLPENTRSVLEPRDYTMLSVSDSGFGMSEDTVSKAFEPFFTTKDTSKGSGLGLAMVFGFAKQSEGHVDILSAPGQGTTVRLLLPRSRKGLVDVVEDAPPLAPGKGESVLLVEDDPDVLRFIDELLVSLGFTVVAASNADEALAMVPRISRPDLLLSDVILTGSQRGPELAKELLDVWPELPVLFMTGYADDVAGINELARDGAEIIRKPFRRNEIASKISTILDGDRGCTT